MHSATVPDTSQPPPRVISPAARRWAAEQRQQHGPMPGDLVTAIQRALDLDVADREAAA